VLTTHFRYAVVRSANIAVITVVLKIDTTVLRIAEAVDSTRQPVNTWIWWVAAQSVRRVADILRARFTVRAIFSFKLAA
jgi:hypothetical protein